MPDTFNLAQETAAAPKQSESNYVAISDAAELKGGGTVYLSRNRKQVARAKDGDRPSVFVTSEVGTVQQSIPFRAIGAALKSDVIPLQQVVELYVSAGRADELLDLLTADEEADEEAAAEAAAEPEADEDENPQA